MRFVLVTGATGVIGSAVVAELLAESNTQVALVLRARSAEHLQERTRQLFEFLLRNLNCHADDLTRIRVHAGDVCEPQFGLTTDSFQQIVQQTTHVIHCAGNVKLNQSLDSARHETITAVQNVVELSREIQSRGQLLKVDVTSTVGIAGATRGAIEERRFTERRPFRNSYEAAKAEAEDLLWQEMDHGLPITIHRPSMVVGNSRNGRLIHFQVFYHLAEFVTGKRTWGLLPELKGATLDIIPSDTVAQAIVIANRQLDSVGRVLHLCSGPELAVSLEKLSQTYHSMCIASGERLPRPKNLPLLAIRLFTAAGGKVMPQARRRALRAIPFFLSYLETPQSFANSRTRNYLEKFGWHIPSPEEYLGMVLETYRQSLRNRSAGEAEDPSCKSAIRRSEPHRSTPIANCEL